METKLKKTKDLWFASFLLLKGYDVFDYTKLSSNKGEYIFDISDEDWKKFKLEFNVSNISKVKYFQEKLKDLIY